jgi:hypothetical protein
MFVFANSHPKTCDLSAEYIPEWTGFQQKSLTKVFSEIATRSLFSWTIFADGIRAEENTLWGHELLESTTDRDDNAGLSESSSSDREDEGNDRNFDCVQKWQDEVPVQFE